MKIDQSLEGKRVEIIDTDGELHEGLVADYIYPEDNEPEGVAAIDLHKDSGEWVGFNETDIRLIKLIN